MKPNVTERIPPHNSEAEKSILGAMLIDKDALLEVSDRLRAEDFYSESHKEIFSAIMDLYRANEPVDILTVAEELKKRKTLEMVGGRAYLGYLSTQVPSTKNVAQYAKIAEEKSILRSLIAASSDIMGKSFEPENQAGSVLEFAEQNIFHIAQKRQRKSISNIKDVVWQNVQKMDEMSKNKGNMRGLTTGFIDLDEMTSGLQKSDLIILAARPSMGKTAFALNIAKNAAIKAGAKVLIFSLEMAEEQLTERILSTEAMVEIQKMRTGDLDTDDWQKIYTAIDHVSKADIMIDDTPGITALEMKNKCRRMKSEKGLDLIVIDYLQLMSVEGKTENRQQEISTLSRYLKQLAREMDCPVITLSQLSRATESRKGDERKPILSDLRESGSIEQDADVVIFLYRDEYYNKEASERPNECDVIIAKHRNGPTGSVALTWLGKYTKFGNKAK